MKMLLKKENRYGLIALAISLICVISGIIVIIDGMFANDSITSAFEIGFGLLILLFYLIPSIITYRAMAIKNYTYLLIGLIMYGLFNMTIILLFMSVSVFNIVIIIIALATIVFSSLNYAFLTKNK